MLEIYACILSVSLLNFVDLFVFSSTFGTFVIFF